MSIHEAIVDEGSTTLMVSPSQRQSSELLGRVRALLSRLPDPPAVVNESALQIRLENGSRILSLPGKEGTIRGYTASTLVLDEAGRIPDELIEATRPMLAASGGRLIAMSTPAGARGWWWEAWVGAGQWHRVEVPAAQCPRISPTFLAEERATLPDVVYRAEYCCEFTDAVDERVPSRGHRRLPVRRGRAAVTRLCVGIDLGKVHDRSAIVVIDRHPPGSHARRAGRLTSAPPNG